jgi:hypothetical protein
MSLKGRPVGQGHRRNINPAGLIRPDRKKATVMKVEMQKAECRELSDAESIMTKHEQTTTIRELTDSELDLASGGTSNDFGITFVHSITLTALRRLR